jgi:hypothetical protein
MIKRMERKAQLQLSFGMIFSIIIIIATIATAFYVISYFLNMNRCTQVGLFYNTLNDEVNKCWEGDFCQKVLTQAIPKPVEKVCFGNFSQTYQKVDDVQFEYLKRFWRQDKNVFLYPASSSCDSNLAFYKLAHVRTDEFFCAPVKSGKITIKVIKTNLEPLVKLARA